jgi:hypothetical protein
MFLLMKNDKQRITRIKNQESRIEFFPILGPQGACKDQHIKE